MLDPSKMKLCLLQGKMCLIMMSLMCSGAEELIRAKYTKANGESGYAD